MAYGMRRGDKIVKYSNGISFMKSEEGLDMLDSYDKIIKNLPIARKILKIQVNQKFALEEAKRRIRESWKREDVIKEYIKTYDDLTRIKNIFGKRIRDFCEIFWPEITNTSNDNMIKLLLKSSQNNKETLIEINRKTELGGEFSEEEIQGFKETVNQYLSIKNYEETLEKEIGKLMQIVPNFSYVATPLIGARLLNAAGSFFKLATMTASTIQVLGAEKAMFMHVRFGKECPKYGFIFEHPLIQKSKNSGKIARQLANKISIAIKKDVFGDKKDIAKELIKEIEEEVNRM